MMGENFFMDVKARLLSSLVWATFAEYGTNTVVSCHPDVIGGIVSFGGCSPLFFDVLRMYGGTDLLLGYSFTPWDSAIYGVGNLIGDNLTYAVWGYFGFELFTVRPLSVFLDSGDGLRRACDRLATRITPCVIGSFWLGSGFGIKMGMQLYL
jgi:hypothetical protein